MLQWRYDIESLFDVPPEAFDPPPRVDSAVVRMVPLARAGRASTAALLSARSSRSRSRSGASCCATRWAAGSSARAPAAAFDVQRRAEEVPVAEYVQLAQTIQRAVAR